MRSDLGPPIVVVGMSRSGTTLATWLLSQATGVWLEMEPIMVWKAGSFQYLEDDRFNLSPEVSSWIGKKLLSRCQGQRLIEKSPPNCLRPELVKSVFPDAILIYVERDPVRCIESNIRRTLSRDSLRARVVLRKYLRPSSAGPLDPSVHIDAFGGMSLAQQMRLRDVAMFGLYSSRLISLRHRLGSLPFGPKISNFQTIIRDNGPISYHTQVWHEATKRKKQFQVAFGNCFFEFQLESLQVDPHEVDRLFDVCALRPYAPGGERLISEISQEVVVRSRKTNSIDQDIASELHRLGYEA